MRSFLLVAIVACGHAQQGSWKEEDAPGVSTGGSQPGRGTALRQAQEGTVSDPIVDEIVRGDDGAIDRASVEELEAAYAKKASAKVAMRRALLAHHFGDDEVARAWLAKVDDAGLAARLKDELSAPVDEKIVAVLLPKSGRFNALGAELEAAIRLADPRGAKLVVIDTKGEEQGARDAVDQAAKRGAIAILGPVGEREAQAAARRAAERGLPIALLAPGDGADPASGVFRLATSPADEATMAADVAAAQGFPSVAVLAPRDDVGDLMANAFVAEAKAKQLDVTGDGRYDPTATDLEPDVKAFLGLDPASNARLAAWLRRYGRKGWQTFVPDVPFSLVYIPDRYDRATIVAAFLPYLGVELRTTEIADVDALRKKYKGRVPQVVQLLGSSGWNHPSLAVRGGNTVEGAMLVDVFAGDRDAGPSGEFANAFHDATGRDPSSAAAQAYDAARIVFAARDGAHTRAEVIRNLAHARLDDGACGEALVGEDGEISRAPIVLQVDSGELTLVPF